MDQHHPSGNGNEGSNGCSVIGRPPVTVIAAPAPSTQNKAVLEVRTLSEVGCCFILIFLGVPLFCSFYLVFGI